MHEHFIIICKDCEKIIAQCRCIDLNKKTERRDFPECECHKKTGSIEKIITNCGVTKEWSRQKAIEIKDLIINEMEKDKVNYKDGPRDFAQSGQDIQNNKTIETQQDMVRGL